MHSERKYIKRQATDAIHESRPSIVWIGLVFLLVILLLNILSMAVSGELELFLKSYQSTMERLDEYATLGDIYAAAEQSAEELSEDELTSSAFGSVLGLAITVMSILLSVGFTLACLYTARRQDTAFGNLFDGFAMFFRGLALWLLRYLLVMIRTAVYIVPVSLLIALVGSPAAAIIISVLGLPLLYVPLQLPAGAVPAAG